MKTVNLNSHMNKLAGSTLFTFTGKVTRVVGLVIEVKGIWASIGDICAIEIRDRGSRLAAEVVGFRDDLSILMPLGNLEGISPGCRVFSMGKTFKINVGKELLGKILNGLGEFISNEPLHLSGGTYPIHNEPPHPLQRKPIGTVLETGIKAVDALLTCGVGQRLGIFAGSGVGKSTLLGMMARNSSADVNVIALIGERGREVLEFIERDLGPEGLARSVVVVSTSDQPALLRVKAALVATAIAEFFRDQGKNVLLMMDSITRFAMAQREIGLAVGEPPTSRGYTPSVFALLPKLLERAGNVEKGSITGLYTILVEGDDMNEPIADAARGILDGHIVLSRKIATRNHFPAIDVLESISRLMPAITTTQHQEMASRLRNYLAIYNSNEDLINIGAYEKGFNPRIDVAIDAYPRIVGFLKQDVAETFALQETLAALTGVLNNREAALN
ncbi:MAG: flagellar protein export ATPase FliI [Syntrophomonadaceae bacterium]|nr:flagellar protein export ATPase FliI [Syntrophomonadaceae bacterium]